MPEGLRIGVLVPQLGHEVLDGCNVVQGAKSASIVVEVTDSGLALSKVKRAPLQ